MKAGLLPHASRLATLEQVVEFYNSGVVDNPNLSPPLRNPPAHPTPANRAGSN